MALHDAGVRVRGEQVRQPGRMRGALQHPAIAPEPALQVLQELPMLAIHRPEVGRVQEVPVARHVPERHEVHGEQRRLPHEVALFGTAGSERMDALQFRFEEALELQCRVRLRDARIGVVRGLVRWRRRRPHFPGRGRTVGRVLRQQRMQERRAGARQPDHEDRLADRLLGNARVALALRDELQPRTQRVDEPSLRAALPEFVQGRLLPYRPRQDRKRLPEDRIAPVDGSGCALSRAHQSFMVEHPHPLPSAGADRCVPIYE